ncbi:acetoin dehydrogenase E2 subunit dihydrolipoyllysine-residue acetyltransferase [Arthrobacter agilis]|uniref:alpha/beta fold hydrolase n=1 Tax=Arthrobacter agilis TaxID=37921 RepID=UPI000B54B57D|nr:alpha/beta fold hydrolase [Arthrobacter agilis]OUM44128.1 alpha/beta hydrolase [Arthrobacter agilis]VDR32577.1 acetoin dehydrogenase E2 subunit dihydrolipoyllysine-residue acetyltransferase [Arthrobacter agilis]
MDLHATSPVEGIEPGLSIMRSDPHEPAPLPPVLLLHGFGSSSARNWQDTGWVRALNEAGRAVVMIDLPAHGTSTAPEDAGAYRPSRMRADILQSLADERVVPLTEGEPTSGVDVIGYSLGSRLAWEFGATQPDLVRRMVLGGPGTADPLASFDLEGAERLLAGGPPPADPTTADLLRMARAVPHHDLPSLLAMVSAIKVEPFDAHAAVPGMPLLLVAGDQDTYAHGIDDLEQWAPDAQVLLLPDRNHANAITSRAFKDAAIDFLGRRRQIKLR